MGLDFTHCEARWSYSSFNNFRRKLAACIGMNLDDMQGFGGIYHLRTMMMTLFHCWIIQIVKMTYRLTFVKPLLLDCVNLSAIGLMMIEIKRMPFILQREWN